MREADIASSSVILRSTMKGGLPCLSLIGHHASSIETGSARRFRAQRADRAHLGHAPAVNDVDIVVLDKGLHDVFGTGGSRR